MNARAYFQAIRPLSLIVWIIFFLQIWLLLLRERAVLDWAPFVGCVFMLPLAVGEMLKHLTEEPARRPFFAFLPGASRSFFKMHLGAFLVCAVLVTVYAAYRVPTVPIMAAAGVIVAAMSVVILLRPFRCGEVDTIVFWAPLPIAVIFWQAEALESWMRQWPWLFGVAGAAIAVASFITRFSKKRRRLLATTPYTDPHWWWTKDYYCGTKTWRNGRSRRWLRALLTGSLRDWVRVVMHVGPSVAMSRRYTVMFDTLVLLVIASAAFTPFHKAGGFNLEETMEGLRRVLWGEGGKVARLGVAMCPLFICLPKLSALRPSLLFPLSRKRQLKLTLAVAGRQWLTLTVVTVLFTLGIGWLACRLAGQPFDFSPTPVFALPLLLAALLPVSLLIRMRGAFTGETQSQLLSALLLAALFLTLPAITTAYVEFIFSSEGWLVVGAIFVATSLLYFFCARKTYLRTDLIRRAENTWSLRL
ncbi:MAG: hypothetical protein QM760_07305 [Nibricoccus sp.]